MFSPIWSSTAVARAKLCWRCGVYVSTAVPPRSASWRIATSGASSFGSRPASSARLPRDLLGRVAQEIRVGPAATKRPLDSGHAVGASISRGRRAWVSRDEFLLIDRRLEAAAQGALGALVEFLEQRAFQAFHSFGFVPRTSATVSTYR